MNIKKVLSACDLGRFQLSKVKLQADLRCMLIIAIFLIFGLQSATALTMPWNKEGKFKKFPSECVTGFNPKFLDNGKILFPGNPNSKIFDPKTNTCQNADKILLNGVYINNDKIFSAAHWIDHPLDDLEQRDKYIDYLRGKIRGKNIAIKNFWYLSPDEKEKLVLPHIRDNESLLRQFNYEKDIYLKNYYGKLFDIKKGELLYTKGKRHIARFAPHQVLLNDGRVFIIGRAYPDHRYDEKKFLKQLNQIEIYDPKTDSFTLVKTNIKTQIGYGGITNNVIKLNDGRIFIRTNRTYIIFDPKTNTLSKPKPFMTGLYNKIIKLNDDRILAFVYPPIKNSFYDKIINPEDIYRLTGHTIEYYYNKPHTYNNHILIFDPKTDTVSYGGMLAVKRGDTSASFNATVLKDNRVLVYGGKKGTDIFGMHSFPLKSAEIYDPKTSKSKIIGNMNYERFDSANAVLFQDGRVLIRDYKGYEIYIPKDYKNKKEEEHK